jgi:hypothetical protein
LKKLASTLNFSTLCLDAFRSIPPKNKMDLETVSDISANLETKKLMAQYVHTALLVLDA